MRRKTQALILRADLGGPCAAAAGAAAEAPCAPGQMPCPASGMCFPSEPTFQKFLFSLQNSLHMPPFLGNFP